jgi:hypothetical protein
MSVIAAARQPAAPPAPLGNLQAQESKTTSCFRRYTLPGDISKDEPPSGELTQALNRAGKMGTLSDELRVLKESLESSGKGKIDASKYRLISINGKPMLFERKGMFGRFECQVRLDEMGADFQRQLEECFGGTIPTGANFTISFNDQDPSAHPTLEVEIGGKKATCPIKLPANPESAEGLSFEDEALKQLKEDLQKISEEREREKAAQEAAAAGAGAQGAASEGDATISVPVGGRGAPAPDSAVTQPAAPPPPNS